MYALHAENQLAARGVPRWQPAAGFEDGELISEHPDAKPNPKVLVRQLLPDGSRAVAVWSYIRSISRAKLVTFYFEDAQ